MAQASLALAELAAAEGQQRSARDRKLARSAADLFERIGASKELKRARQLAAK